MTETSSQSSRVFVRYNNASSVPTDDDIRNIFSVHGQIVEIDRRQKFSFVEFDTDAAAQKAVDAENGRDFNGINLRVELAVGSRKVRNTDDNDSSTAPSTMSVSTETEKKSSFAASEWLAQREAAKKADILPSTDNEVSSSSQLNVAANNSSSTESNRTERHQTSAAAAAARHQHQRTRSRSPCDNTPPRMKTAASKMSQSSKMQHLRQLEVKLEQQLRHFSASKLPSTSAKQMAAYYSEQRPSAYGSESRERELLASRSAHIYHHPALRRPTASSFPVESYLAQTGRDVHASSRHMSPPRYDNRRDSRAESTYDHTKQGSSESSRTGTSVQCEIFIHRTSDSDYAKHVAVRIERIGLLVHISLLGTDVHIMDEVSSAMNRGCLFALSITGVQSSPTLYILHGEPEEHRNMLLEDAVVMIAKSYADYTHRRQTAAVSAPAPATLSIVSERLRPDAATRRLIGLLSADCELTNSELEHIITYLKFRQTALVSARHDGFSVATLTSGGHNR